MAKMVSFVMYQFHSLSRVQLFATPWTAARQASLSITDSQSLLKLMSIESVMPSNRLILCRPLLLPPSVFPGISSFQFSSVTQSCPILCDPMNHSMPGLPVSESFQMSPFFTSGRLQQNPSKHPI